MKSTKDGRVEYSAAFRIRGGENLARDRNPNEPDCIQGSTALLRPMGLRCKAVLRFHHLVADRTRAGAISTFFAREHPSRAAERIRISGAGSRGEVVPVDYRENPIGAVVGDGEFRCT